MTSNYGNYLKITDILNKMFENIYEAEHAIQELIKNDNNCSAHFAKTHLCNNNKNAITTPTSVKLDLITYNPEHKTPFLLHSISAHTELAAVNAMYTHIYKLKNTLASPESGYVNYTIEWGDKKDGVARFSSFYGSDVEDIVKKFYYGKSKKSLNIFNIKLNPVT